MYQSITTLISRNENAFKERINVSKLYSFGEEKRAPLLNVETTKIKLV
jgi:hypothetical protein